jgi:hypothetical protein
MGNSKANGGTITEVQQILLGETRPYPLPKMGTGSAISSLSRKGIPMGPPLKLSAATGRLIRARYRPIARDEAIGVIWRLHSAYGESDKAKGRNNYRNSPCTPNPAFWPRIPKPSKPTP